MSTFAWLAELMQFVVSFIPRVLIVEATHGGVAFIRGSNIKPLTPGIYVYWPLWTKVETIPTVRQTVNLPAQALTTLDGQQVVAAGMVRYQIQSVTKALAQSWDVDRAIVDESLVVFCEYVTAHSFGEIQKDRATVNKALTQGLRSSLLKYGVRIELAQLTDFSVCLTLNHVGQLLKMFSREEQEE